tara:strand:+ start:2223 stop:3476 length:1254 start_codon:yes stop_codon:yes gene_type:complete
MKIIPSLKLYFLVMMLITGVATISIMSVVSFKYFIYGIDIAVGDSMRSIANIEHVSEGNPVGINDFVVASQWQDLPLIIQEKLDQNSLEEGQLLKALDGKPPFSPPKAAYFVIKLNVDGQERYISSMFTAEDRAKIGDSGPPPFINLLLIGLTVMALFTLAPYFILRKIANPVEKLMLWAKQLNKKKLSEPTPNFHYSELNSLAKIVQSSLQSVQSSLKREQRFLGYASHELRTPIAVTRTNAELLRKMIEKGVSSEKQLAVLDRIERASLTMTDLTETLLWLNRQPDKSIPVKSISIGLMTQQLLEQLTYLLNGKNVKVSIETDISIRSLPEALCQIVITNLIRNALQHTQEGSIIIKQSANSLVITNQNISEDKSSEELGFGLGLELTERLVQHYGWQYKNVSTANEHYVEINFS